MALAFALMAVRLSTEGWRLVGRADANGANDLRLRYGEVERWFSDLPVYTSTSHAGYPPASYAILWPMLGWLGEWPARWLWAISTLVALTLLARLTIQQGAVTTRTERVLLLLFLLSIYPTAITIGNGQLGIHVLAALLCGLSLLGASRPASLRNDLLAAALLLFAMVKPSLSAPFFWIVLFVPRRLRPAILVIAGYIALTALAVSFQPRSVGQLLSDLMNVSGKVIAFQGGAELPYWLTLLGLSDWNTLASLLVLAALGVWVYRNRQADLWLLISVAALVARLWTYHRVYDDLLIFVPVVMSYRILKRREFSGDQQAAIGLLGLIALLGLEAPASLAVLPAPWSVVYYAGQTIIWLSLLVFLLWYSRRTPALPAEPSPAR